MSSGLFRSAAPIPPLIENDLGQPILISIAATSLHLKKEITRQNNGLQAAKVDSHQKGVLLLFRIHLGSQRTGFVVQ